MNTLTARPQTGHIGDLQLSSGAVSPMLPVWDRPWAPLWSAEFSEWAWWWQLGMPHCTAIDWTFLFWELTTPLYWIYLCLKARTAIKAESSWVLQVPWERRIYQDILKFILLYCVTEISLPLTGPKHLGLSSSLFSLAFLMDFLFFFLSF